MGFGRVKAYIGVRERDQLRWGGGGGGICLNNYFSVFFTRIFVQPAPKSRGFTRFLPRIMYSHSKNHVGQGGGLGELKPPQLNLGSPDRWRLGTGIILISIFNFNIIRPIVH